MLLQAQGPDGSFWIMMALLMLVFYFFMIRPQAKKAREARKFREELKKGDKVITIGGIHGKVIELKDKSVLMEVDSGTKLRVERSAISMDNSEILNEQTVKQVK